MWTSGPRWAVAPRDYYKTQVNFRSIVPIYSVSVDDVREI